MLNLTIGRAHAKVKFHVNVQGGHSFLTAMIFNKLGHIL